MNEVLLVVFSHASCTYTASLGWIQDFPSVCLGAVTTRTLQHLSLLPHECSKTSSAHAAGLLKCYMTLILANESSN